MNAVMLSVDACDVVSISLKAKRIPSYIWHRSAVSPFNATNGGTSPAVNPASSCISTMHGAGSYSSEARNRD